MADEKALPDFDALWNYDDAAATEAQFRQLLPLAVAAGDTSYHAALLTQLARTYSLRGLFAEAHALLDEVAACETAVSPLTWSRYLLERGRTYRSAGQAETAVPLFHDALSFAQQAGAAYHALDAIHMLAIASPPAEQIAWGRKGLQLAAQTADVRAQNWRGALLNNLAWTYHDQGQYAAALDLFQQALVWREAHSADKPDTIRIARWSVARALRSLGRFAEALAMQQALLAAYEAAGAEDGFVYEELGECLLALGRAAEARPYFAQAYSLLVALGWVEADRLQRLSALAQEAA
ncbi:MAG: tetratricopeptide repeat protein [Chloroflexota bacterium]